jgi:hypothetical protein
MLKTKLAVIAAALRVPGSLVSFVEKFFNARQSAALSNDAQQVNLANNVI